MTEKNFKKTAKAGTAIILAFMFSFVFLIATHADDEQTQTSSSEATESVTQESTEDTVTETEATTETKATTAAGRTQRTTTERTTHTNPYRTTTGTSRSDTVTATTDSAQTTSATTTRRNTATGTGIPNNYNRTTDYSGVPTTYSSSDFTTAYTEPFGEIVTDENSLVTDEQFTGFTWQYTSESFESPEFSAQADGEEDGEEGESLSYRKWTILLMSIAAAAIIAGAVLTFRYFSNKKISEEEKDLVKF